MPLIAKQITAPRAVISIRVGRRCSVSAKTAVIAKIIPRVFSHRGARTGAPSAVRRRSSNRSAASPIAATTTNAIGLKNAPRSV